MRFASGTPHFYKIILDESVGDDKLQVPKKFAHKYGDAIPSHVQLKVPNGEVWFVEFKRYDNDEVWLQNGWKHFGERYSLSHGDMVLFKYKGNGHFNVVIFDMTATEIEYPQNSDHSKNQSFQKTCKDPNFVKIEEDTLVKSSVHVSRSKRKDISPLPSSRAHEIKKTVQDKNTISSCHFNCNSQNAKVKLVSSGSPFESEKPVFRVVMRRSYLKKHGPTKNVPFKFARTYLNESQGDIVLKVVSDDKIWNVRYKLRVKNGCLVSAKFYDGWKTFVQDNELKINDVCVFELECGKMITLNVFIFAGEEVPN